MAVSHPWGRRCLQALALLAVVWTGAIVATGGFVVRLAGLRVTAHDVWRPLILSLLCLLGSAVLAAPERRLALRADAAWWWSLFMATLLSPVRACRALRLDAPILAALAGGGFILLQWLRARPLWLDEQMIAINVRDRGLAELAGELWLGQSAPLGWLALQRLSLVAAGTGELAVRAVPVAFAIGMLAVACWAGRRWMSSLGATTLVVLLTLGTWTSHYALELKHYSADLFFGLTLPVLVVWALEPAASDTRRRRTVVWWLVAALGVWFSNGAVLVTPACVAVLIFATWRRDGASALLRLAGPAVIWGVAFALHYVLAIRFTLDSTYLQDYWAFGLPPAEAGVVDTIRWLGGRFEPIADKPVGSGLGLFFWLAVACGGLMARSRHFAAVLSLVALSVFVFAAARQVPIFERLSLWAVPSLYVGLALAVDAAARWYGHRDRRARIRTGLLAIAVSLGGLWVAVDVVRLGWYEFEVARPADSNHQLDDRAAVGWLAERGRPGDVLLTTRLAVPALLWYGGGEVTDDLEAALQAGGHPILEVGYRRPGRDCHDETLARPLAGYRRALVYLGFRFDDVPDQFDEVLLDSLTRLGSITDEIGFAGATRVVIVDLERGPSGLDGRTGAAPDTAGCVVAESATRW